MNAKWISALMAVVLINAYGVPALGEEYSVQYILQNNPVFTDSMAWLDETADPTYTGGWGADLSSGTEAWRWSSTAPYAADASLVVEYAGYSEINSFGWYDALTFAGFASGDEDTDVDDGSIPTGKTWGEIFPGSADAGAKETMAYGDLPSTFWGFYVRSPGHDWFSEAKRNVDDGGTTHQRVYKRYLDANTDVYGLFWEDLSTSKSAAAGWKWYRDHDGAWVDDTTKWYVADGDVAGPIAGATKYGNYEPDYNDLSVRFRLEGGSGGDSPTPELPASALLLFGMVPVAIGYARSKRRGSS